jgi:hypothetical protein
MLRSSIVNISGNTFIIIALYRSPNSSFTEFIQCFENMCNAIYKDKFKSMNLIITGDFNIDFLTNSRKRTQLYNLFNLFNLNILIKHPTRKFGNASSCLDNILINFSIPSARTQIFESGLSDHSALILNLESNKCKNKSYKRRIRDFSKDNITHFSDSLQRVSWRDVYLIKENADMAFEQFLRNFLLIFDECFPAKYINNKVKPCQWLTAGIRTSCRNKRKIAYEAKLSNDPTLHSYFKMYKKILRSVIKLAKIKYNSNLLSSSNNKIKTIWKIIQSTTGKSRKGLETIKLLYSSSSIDDPGEVAERLNIVFSDHNDFELDSTDFNGSHLKDEIDCETNKFSETLSTFGLTNRGEVLRTIMSLSNSSSCGWDEINSKIVKSCSSIISAPLAYIINLAIITGHFPGALKYSIIKPVFKNKGSNKSEQNYRPIAMLPIFAKIFEKIINARLIYFLEDCQILSEHQFGFRKKKSTMMAVNELVSQVLEDLEKSKKVSALFFDLTRAFDNVCHSRLVMKLRKIGIGGSALDLISSYLQERYQKVGVPDEFGKLVFSSWRKIGCGVPQGSILGPTLFLVYINDLPNYFESQSILYADDTNFIISSDDLKSHEKRIASVISGMFQWCALNHLTVNLSKSKLLHFNCPTELKIHGIEDVGNVKFLGVVVDSGFSWREQIDHVVSKLSSATFAMKKLANSVDRRMIKIAYHAYSESIIRYGIIFWGGGVFAKRVLLAQKRLLRAMSGIGPRDSCKPIFREMKILTVPAIFIVEVLNFFAKNPETVSLLSSNYGRKKQRTQQLIYPKHKRGKTETTPLYNYMKIFNTLPSIYKNGYQVKIKEVKKFLLTNPIYNVNEFLKGNGGTQMYTGDTV